MYSTCIHCQRDLGNNALLEHLPIGRRVAFDAAAGRVWVICGSCSRWNLVPFESRWEAIEEAEKSYRASPLRASTGEVGLARSSEGSELVRIGRPVGAELPSWRYGRHFGKRRWKYLGTTFPLMVLVGVASQPSLFMDFLRLEVHGWARLSAMIGAGLVAGEINARAFMYRTLATLPLVDGNVTLSRITLHSVMAARGDDDDIKLWMPVVPTRIEDQPYFHRLRELPRLFGDIFRRGEISRATLNRPTHYTAVQGDEAATALRTVLPLMNESGASQNAVKSAVEVLVSNGSAPARVAFDGQREWDVVNATSLSRYSRERRLALEMAVHADSERRWLEGEMAALLAEWRRASEIASIADAILRDPAIETKLDALRDSQTVRDQPSA